MDIKRPIIYQKRTQTSIVNRVVNKNAPDIILQSGTPNTTKSSYIQALVTKNFKNKLGRFAYVGLSAVFLLSLIIAIPPLQQSINYYDLPSNIKSLVGDTDPELAQKLTFDSTKQVYQYNKQTDNTQPGTPPASQSIKASAGAENYALDMPVDPKAGLTTYDLKNDISIKMIPQFKLREGKNTEGRVVYPLLNSDAQLIYSPKGNGVKEDLVLPYKTKDKVSFSYRLELPKTLEARLLENGDVGIFGGDPSLFGNISYGSDEDRAKVELAREKSAKTNLLFAIPAPVIVESKVHSPQSIANEAQNTGEKSFDYTQDEGAGNEEQGTKASFTLENNVLTVTATGLHNANYPLSIDPSVVVTSASDFTKGNQEGNIEFDTANNQIKRASLTGGSVGGWSTDASTFTTARYFHTTVVSNGYVYVMGGQNASFVQNDVQYAKFGSSGALATDAGCGTAWCTTSSFTTGRAGLSGFTYNGFIYIAGGYNGSFLSDVQYAKPSPSGALEADAGCGTAWCTTSSFTGGRWGHNTVVYNGYAYLLTGCSSVFAVVCNGYPSDVSYATIKGDGTLGTWTATGVFPSPRQWAGVTVYNGYIYVSGGEFSGTVYNDVYYAPINSDGTIPTTNWATTTTFSVSTRSQHSMQAYQGHMYIFGGNVGGSSQSDVLYAPINSNGTVGAWKTTSSFTSSRFLLATATYNGYLYIFGGCNVISVNCDVPYNDTQYAKINPAGVASSYAATTSFTTSRDEHTSVAYNGYLYIIGGCNSYGLGCATPQSDVQYAPINANGTIGSWTATTSFTTARFGHTSVVFNGYLYVISGNSGGGFLADVQYAPINTNGTVGAWTATTSLAAGRINHTSFAYNNYLYILGGYDGGPLLSDVQYAPINANGTIGSWTATTSFSGGRSSHSIVANGGYAYVIGGNSGADLSDVQYAPINANGTIGSWTATTSLPAVRTGQASVAHNGYLYVVGGSTNGGKLNDTQYARFNANGTIGNWTATTSFVTPRLNLTAVVHHGYLYMAGGVDASTTYNDVQYAQINNGGKGTVSSWTTNGTSFTTSRAYHGSVAYNGYLYVLGGSNGSALSDVQYAQINTDGSIGTWNTTTSLPTARYGFTVSAYHGYMFISGGADGSGALTEVRSIPFNTNGTLGSSWATLNSFTSARNRQISVIYNGFIYVGGGDNGALTPYGDVQYAPINTNGTIGTWNTTTSLPTTRWGSTSFAANGYLYVLGGCANFTVLGGCNTVLSDVVSAPINSNGTLGSWTATNSMPSGLYDFPSVIANGYVYVMGGFKAGIGATNEAAYAPINANGTIGIWTFTTSLPGDRLQQGAIHYNGRIYNIGGCSVTGVGCGGFLNDVVYSGQEAIPKTARYSQAFDTAGDSTATKFYYRSAGGSRPVISYKAANNSTGTFSTPTSVFDLSSNVLKPFSISESRYYQLTFILDDSQNAVFPDVLSTAASVSDFEMYYHPAPAKRLRGGKTFTNQQQQTLDAQP